MNDPTKVAFVSLGCAKNIVDSEKMLGQLAEADCAITADESDADVIVVNTCGFLNASRIEADSVISEAIERKQRGEVKRVVVAGCLVQRDNQAILDRLPGIDAIVGVNNRDDIVRAVMEPQHQGGRSTDVYLSDYHPFVQLDNARLRITPRHYTYLRISEGCDQKCTFCTIPSIRGRMHCKPPQVVLAEAQELVGDGAVEISIIGQDTTSYGLGEDRFDTGLAELLRSLGKIDALTWIRLMYVYPSVLTDDILDAMAECSSVCNYIDIPLQHISDHMLKAMHRRITRRETEQLLQRIRDRIPGVTMRTTLIAGFPGETEEDFSELLTFIEDFRFDALGVFPYSNEPDTPAGRMRDQIPQELIEERVDTLMLAQQAVAFEEADKRIGSRFSVLVDERLDDDTVMGRHEGQAPQVDSATLVQNCQAEPGDFVEVTCVERDNYDLVARPTQVALPMCQPKP